ncbi:efflux RND transporter periplasmic adaptor subunit [Corallococcus sp. AB050B]|nr:efflux RND transporter periplasmic adaptor subunit [Corallococcus sp. AB050B]
MTGSRRAWAWVTTGVLLLGPGGALAAPPGEAQEPARVLTAPRPLLGVVVASQVLDVVSEVEGRLSEVKARLGDRVEAGQVLATLDPEPLKLELSARQANARAAEAEHERASLLLTQAKQKLQREQRIRAYSAAEALEAAESTVALAEADRTLAQARLSEARTRLAQAERDVAQARIRAPFTGIITEQYLTPGMRVGRATPLLRVVSDDLRLRFAVPETLAPSVRPGLPVRVRLAAVDAELVGTVERVAPEVDPASRHQKAEAVLTVPDALRARLSSGLLAEVFLQPPAETRTRGTQR